VKNEKIIIIISFAVYPDLKSSEGIVNNNWIEILKKTSKCFVLSAFSTLFIKKIDFCFKNESSWLLKKMYHLSISKKKLTVVILYKILNKITLFFSKFNLFQNLWIYYQTKKIVFLNNFLTDHIVWLRILPVWPLQIIENAYKKKSFPLIINCNDPLLAENIEEYHFKKSIKITQCWTFPSLKLAQFFSEKYNLDSNRCFVIPHAMRKQEIIFNEYIDRSVKLNYVYAGTFYKSAFTESFKKQLFDFGNSFIGKQVVFTFILSQYDQQSIKWLKSALPNLILKFEIDRLEVLEIIKKSDCVLVVDSEAHKILLKGKLIEAFSFGVPVFAITYQNSVMDVLVKKYGSFCGYHDIEGSILTNFFHIVENLKSDDWRIYFCEERKEILKMINEEKIFELTNSVNEFAYRRFLWEQKKAKDYPKRPKGIDWP
jgi:hypothetical protein